MEETPGLVDASGQPISSAVAGIDTRAIFLNEVTSHMPAGFQVAYTETEAGEGVKIENRQGRNVIVPIELMKAIMTHAKDGNQVRLAVAQLYARIHKTKTMPNEGDQIALARAAEKRERRRQKLARRKSL